MRRSKRKRKVTEAELIASLIARKESYEKYFESKESKSEEHDHRAEQAYTGLIKTLIEILRKSEPEDEDPEEMKKVAKEILQEEYGISLE